MDKVIRNRSYLFLFCLLMIPSLMLSQGSRYTGTYKKSPEIRYEHKSNIVIEGLELSNIDLRHCDNITIKNCKLGPTALKAIFLYKCSNITIKDCSFDRIQTGLLANQCTGNIKFEYNDVKNIQGEPGNESVQMAQFVLSSGTGNSVSYNACDNIPGESSVEDMINMFASSGTPESPIMIVGNWIRGGGPSKNGGGIVLGDSGGSYIIAENNICVNSGAHGVSIAGGHDMIIRNNKIFSKQTPSSGTPITVWDWWSWKGTDSFPLHNTTVENNEYNWTNKEGHLHPIFTHENAGYIKGLETNKYNPNLNESILPEVIIGRARLSVNDKPEVDKPDNNTSEGTIFEVYSDSFNRISVKCLINPVPPATAEIYSSNIKIIDYKHFSMFRTLIDRVLSPGVYYINVSYGNPIKTETTKVTIY